MSFNLESRSNIIGMGNHPLRRTIENLADEHGFPDETTMLRTGENGRAIANYNGEPLLPPTSERALENEVELLTTYLMTTEAKDLEIVSLLTGDEIENGNGGPHYPSWMKLQYTDISPMSEDCIFAIGIPARYEAPRIMAALEGWRRQKTLGKSKFQVDIFDSFTPGEAPDGTLEQVMNFKRLNPAMNINIISAHLDRKYSKPGRKRKILGDLAIYQALARKNYLHPLYLIPTDADELDIDPYYLAKTLARLDTDPTVDIVRGHHERLGSQTMDNDLVVLSYRGKQIIELLMRDQRLRDPERKGFNWQHNRIDSAGPNAIRASAYAMIGGIVKTHWTLEDHLMAQADSFARGYIKPEDLRRFVEVGGEAPLTYPYLKNVGLISVNVRSNAIRLMLSLLPGGTSPYETTQFTRDKTATEGELLASLSQFSRLNPDDRANIGAFTQALDRQLDYLKKCVGDNKLFKTIYRPRFLNYLGFKEGDYRFGEKEAIVVDNWQSVQAKLDRTREHRIERAWDIANSYYDPAQQAIAAKYEQQYRFSHTSNGRIEQTIVRKRRGHS